VVRDLVEKSVHGTIHCSALDTHGDMGCVTTTSGLGYKVHGRVGDSPILAGEQAKMVDSAALLD
jgi:N4-(beta-N-acetylglucosaminyl)-L-asparaginase